MELTQDEQDKFDLMLSAEKKLRDASTQEQIDAAMHEYEKSGMLREQEIDRLRHQGRMADLRNTQEYDMAELKGDLARKREQAAYDDERRRVEINLDKEEQESQLDILRQAQAIRLERENAEHQRRLEAENAARAHEAEMQKTKLNAYAGMSVEQIMAANPDISPEAAKALAQKFASEGKDELLRAREADMARQNTQQMEMLRMMQQMAIAGMGVNQQHQQEMMATKQAELDRARIDATRNEDRLLSGVQTAVNAAGVAFAGRANAGQQLQRRKEMPPSAAPAPSASAPTQSNVASPSASSSKKCPKCGTDLELDSSFCGECGTAL